MYSGTEALTDNKYWFSWMLTDENSRKLLSEKTITHIMIQLTCLSTEYPLRLMLKTQEGSWIIDHFDLLEAIVSCTVAAHQPVFSSNTLMTLLPPLTQQMANQQCLLFP